MEIWHRIMFHRLDGLDGLLASLKVKYKKNPLPGNSYVITLAMAESDPLWATVNSLVQAKKAPNMYDTIFNDEEILAAEWVRLMPVFEQGYPQPEEGWEELTYEAECPRCGTGFRQKVPFHLAREPRMGKSDFLSLYWASALFCTPRVMEKLQEQGIRGYEVWPATIHRTGQPSQVVSQLVFAHVAEPALEDEDKLDPKVCANCGMTKYAYHKRGYMHLKRKALRHDIDCQLTYEWFGSGGLGFREFLVSHTLAKLILDEGWRGVRLKPVELSLSSPSHPL